MPQLGGAEQGGRPGHTPAMMLPPAQGCSEGERAGAEQALSVLPGSWAELGPVPSYQRPSLSLL